ncbi:hypothetical protein ACHAXR_000447, partial [Thalassiosira sp. AJA248-18]
GRAGGLESACKALDSLEVDIAFLQECKLTDGVYTRKSSDYSIVASDAPSAHQGGVALCWRDSDAYEVEETKIWSPNVIAFRLITEAANFYVVGCYIPPSDPETLEHVEKAWENCPKGFRPLLIGDMNINLESPRDERDETIAEQCDFWDLSCMSAHFMQRRHRRVPGRWSRVGANGDWVDGFHQSLTTSWLNPETGRDSSGSCYVVLGTMPQTIGPSSLPFTEGGEEDAKLSETICSIPSPPSGRTSNRNGGFIRGA